MKTIFEGSGEQQTLVLICDRMGGLRHRQLLLCLHRRLAGRECSCTHTSSQHLVLRSYGDGTATVHWTVDCESVDSASKELICIVTLWMFNAQ